MYALCEQRHIKTTAAVKHMKDCTGRSLAPQKKVTTFKPSRHSEEFLLNYKPKEYETV